MKCEVCQKEFSNEFALFQHQCGRSSHKCKVCKKDFPNNQALSQHIDDAHSKGSGATAGGGAAVCTDAQVNQPVSDVGKTEWQARKDADVHDARQDKEKENVEEEEDAWDSEEEQQQDLSHDRKRWQQFCRNRMKQTKNNVDRALWLSRSQDPGFLEDVDGWIENFRHQSNATIRPPTEFLNAAAAAPAQAPRDQRGPFSRADAKSTNRSIIQNGQM